MEGLAVGIQSTADVPSRAMEYAMARTTAPTITTTNNLTLNVTTSAPAEPIVADFGMLRALGGLLP